MTTALGKPLLNTVLSLAVCACASGRLATQDPNSTSILLNGQPVKTTKTQTVLDVLRATVPELLLLETASPDDQPLVLVNGITRVDGVRSLGELAANQVWSVTTMLPAEAVLLHGPTASKGAIVATTERDVATAIRSPSRIEHRLLLENATPDVIRVTLAATDREVSLGRWQPFETRSVSLHGSSIVGGQAPARIVVTPIGAPALNRPGLRRDAAVRSELYSIVELVSLAWRFSGSRVVSRGPVDRGSVR